MEDLRECMQNLHTLVTNTGNTLNISASDTSTVNNILDNVKQICANPSEPLFQKDAANACSILFHEEFGLLKFLTVTAIDKRFDNAKNTALVIITEFFKRFKDELSEYATDAQDVCFTLFLRCKTASVRNFSLLATAQILEIYYGTKVSKNFKIDEKFKYLFDQLSQASKLPPSVKQGIYNILGVLAQYYPESINEKHARILVVFLNELKVQMTSKIKPFDPSVVAGCFQGLTGFLHSFTVSAEEDPVKSRQLYDNMVSVLNPSIMLCKYEIYKSALQLLSKHAGQFGPFLYADYEKMYNCLAKWSQHNNRELRGDGFSAMDTFLKEISARLIEKACKGDDKSVEIFQFFILKFKEVITSQETSENRQSAIAIKGYGLFVPACKYFPNEKGLVKYMFIEMLQRTEYLKNRNSIVLEEKMALLPSYIESLSSIIKEMDEISQVHLGILQQIAVFQIENFPYMSTSFHFLCYKSLFSLLLSLQSKKTVFTYFLHETLYQSIVRTCSHPIMAESELLKEVEGYTMEEQYKINQRVVTYKNYLDLWFQLTDIFSMKVLNQLTYTVEEKQNLTQSIYDEIIISVISIIKKLDLNATKKPLVKVENGEESPIETQLETADPVLGLEAVNPKDFRIFINLVDFSRDLLLKKNTTMFEKWVYTFGLEMMKQSSRLPHVSGFYKLVALCLELCSKIKYFADMENNTERQTFFQLVIKFSKEVLVRFRQFKDDLLASCLRVILALPAEIIVADLTSYIPALQLTFKLGLGYLPLANVGLTALEKWCNQIQLETLENDFLPKILPCLVKFLSAGIFQEKSRTNKSTFEIPKKSKSRGAKSEILKKAKPNYRPGEKYAEDFQLTTFRLRVLKFLGSLGGRYNKSALILDTKEIEQIAIAWDIVKRNHLKFAIPFADMKLDIYLDDFLPQVVHLALNSGDRQTKVTACELLHTLVLFMVGKGSQEGTKQDTISMAKLYDHIFPALLSLACDVEDTAVQLFIPLVNQLIHWFTNKSNIFSEETKSLHNAIWDGITNIHDTKLRDFSALCLKEFVIWSVKQSPKSLDSAGYGVKSVIDKIYSYSLHPNSAKRLGACLAFNNIYTIMREDENYVRIFSIKLTVHFVDCLSISHRDPKELGTQTQCKQAIEHMERILKARADILEKPHDKVDKPTRLDEPTFGALIMWLLTCTASPQTETRHVSMELVSKLAPFYKDYKSPRNFIQDIFSVKGRSYFNELLEETLSRFLDDLNENVTLNTVTNWMEQFVACIEAYCWFLGQNLLNYDQLFESNIYETPFAKSVKYALENVLVKNIQEYFGGVSFSPKETLDYNHLKCTLVVRLMTLTSVLCENFDFKKTPENWFFNEKLFKILGLVILVPYKLDFDMADLEISSSLPDEVDSLIIQLKKRLPKEILQNFTEILNEIVEKNDEINLIKVLNDSNITERFQNGDTLKLSCVVKGYYQLNVILGVKLTKKTSTLSCTLLKLIWNNGVLEKSREILPTTSRFTSQLIRLLFVYEKYPIKDIITKFLESDENLSVFLTFKNDFCQYMSQNGTETVEELVNNFTRSSGSQNANTILINLLEFLVKNKDACKKYGEEILNNLILKWDSISFLWLPSSSQEQANLSLVILTKILLINTGSRNVKLFNTFSSLLKRQSVDLGFMSQVLDLMPFFIESKENLFQLKNDIEVFSSNNLPINSREFPEGSAKRNDYVSILRKFYQALVLTGSCTLLETISVFMCRETNHLLSDEFQICLTKTLKSKHPNDQLELLKTAFKLWREDKTKSFDFQTQVAFQILLPLLRQTNLSCFTSFYVNYISEIVAIIKIPLIKYPENECEEFLIRVSVAFEMVTFLYTRLQEEAISEVNRSGKTYTGKELTPEITAIAHNVKKLYVETTFSTNLKELGRKYHCAAYNTISAILCCTQNEERFFHAFLFVENKSKGSYVWENIIDLQKEYRFESEIEDNENHKKLSVLRQSLRDNDDYGGVRSDYTKSLRYLSSKYLSESSLSEDVSQFDFSSSQQAFKRSKGRAAKITETNSAPSDENIELEQDELNNHECMRNMVVMVEVMAKKGLIPELKEDYNMSLTKCLLSVVKKLEEPNVHRNITLFLTRFIILNEKLLRPFAGPLSDTLLNLIGRGAFGSELDLFLIDVLLLAIEWSNLAKTEVSDLTASAIVEFLIEKSAHERRAIFRRNLDIVKLCVEHWRSKLTLNYKNIYDLLKSDRKDLKIVGIQLLGVLLANKLPPYQNTPEVSRETFLKSVLANVSSEIKDIYAPSCEVIGMILNYMEEKEDLIDEPFYNELIKTLTAIGNINAKKAQFVTRVSYVCLHFPPLADSFFSKLLFSLPTAQGYTLTKILESINGRVEKLPNAFQELKSKGVFKILEHGSEETDKILVLKILMKIVDNTSSEMLYEVVGVLNDLRKYRNAVSRETLYSLFIVLYQKYKQCDNVSNDDSIEAKILNASKDVLLQGLTDSENVLRIKCCNFWSEKTQLPTETVARMKELLLNMYSPLTESQFLQYCSYLFLEMTSKSPDFNRNIYDTPLSKCKFENYQITPSWRQRNTAMTPLFTDSFINRPGATLAGSLGDFGVKATQENNQAFTATQDMRGKVTDWVTQSSLDTFANDSSSVSSMLFSNPTSPSTSRVNVPGGGGPLKTGAQDDGKFNEFKRLRRRFLKNQESTRKHFMKVEIRKKEMREVTRKEQITRREAQVTMYRQYRTGELPDIEITYNALITPLQALAQQDSNVAKTLVSKMVLAITNELKNDEFERFSKCISDSMNRILSKSSRYFPPVVAFAQEVLYKHVKHVELLPENVAIASQISNQHNTGILLLEAHIEKLKSVENELTVEPVQKKPKLDSSFANNNERVTAWIKLAEIYKSLDNFDMVRSIFSLGVEIQEDTRQAMECETNGDYASAIHFYNQLYEKVNQLDNSNDIKQAEINYWDDSILKCYAEMTSWDKLEKVISNRLPNSDDLNSVWDDPFSQEHLLPYIVKSKLKTILEGQNNQSLLTFIDNSLKDKDKKIVIEGKFSEELAMLYLIQENYNQANYLSDLSLRNFLEEWTGLSPLIPGAREKVFSSLQKLSEMNQFLELVSKSNSESETRGITVIKKWENRLPAFNDATCVWDDVILNRQFYLQKLNAMNNNTEKNTLENSMEIDIGVNFYVKSIINMKLALINNACLQKNMTVASKTIQWITEKLNEDDNLKEELWVKSIHAHCKIYNLRANKLQNTPTKMLDTMLSVWYNLRELEKDILGKSSRENKLNHHLYVAENLNQLSLGLKNDPDSFRNVKSSKKNDFLQHFGVKETPELVVKLEKCSFDHLKKALSFTKLEKISQSTMKLVSFCNKRLRDIENSSNNTDLKLYATTFIESLFTALKNNENQGIILLPRALQLVRENQYLIPNFVKNCSKIPSWMFISCLDEILTLLDKPNCSNWIHPIVNAICDEYPNALVYPFNVASEGFEFEDTQDGRENQAFVEKIASKLDKLVLVREFLTALNYLRAPHIILKDALSELNYLNQKGDREKIAKVVEKLWNETFNVETRGGRRYKLGGYGGKFHDDFAKEFKETAVHLLGDKLQKLTTLKGMSIAYDLYKKITPDRSATKRIKLEYLSSWLHKFQSFDYKDEIEIPGQYSGFTKPNPEYHVKISGFDQNVIILSSLESPRKLIIRGNDEKEYTFLVKFGEDLRQDERIEKTFRIMNNIFAHDTKSASENLKINTYNVIPLSSRFGLIQWVDNTMTLKILIEKYLTKEQKKALEGIPAKFQVWALKGSDNKANPYYIAYSNRTENEVIALYNDLISEVPSDLFRTIFLSLSSSLESFLTLRNKFIKCHSVLCVSQWILGIGDRHLSNTLLKCDTGEEVGIDFGHAFGSATQKLGIPELVPFRLTPQFVNLISPMGVQGLIETTMIHALEALRNNKEILMDVLDIFIKAPTIEFKRSDFSKSNENSYAKEKVEIARKKLNGANPAAITIEELELGHGNKEIFPSFVKFAIGNRQVDIRAKLPNNNLNVKNQVLCLINQATDPKLLGLTYAGWQPWI